MGDREPLLDETGLPADETSRWVTSPGEDAQTRETGATEVGDHERMVDRDERTADQNDESVDDESRGTTTPTPSFRLEHRHGGGPPNRTRRKAYNIPRYPVRKYVLLQHYGYC